MTGIWGAKSKQLSLAVISVFFALGVMSSFAQSDRDIEVAHAAMMADSGLQHQFTGYEQPEAPGWLQGFEDILNTIGRFLAPFIKFVFWAGLFVLGAFVLFVLGRMAVNRLHRETKSTHDEPADIYQPTQSFARALLEEADQLARDGNFAEAVHVLLFRSIEDIQLHRPHSLSVSLTSREIAQLDILPSEARRQFVKIANAVERSQFAGGLIEAESFASCRDAYMAFARSESWS